MYHAISMFHFYFNFLKSNSHHRPHTCASSRTTMDSQWFSCFQRSSLLDSDSDAFQSWSPRLPNTLHDPDDQFGSILDRCLPPSGGTFPNCGSHVRIGCLPPAVRGMCVSLHKTKRKKTNQCNDYNHHSLFRPWALLPLMLLPRKTVGSWYDFFFENPRFLYLLILLLSPSFYFQFFSFSFCLFLVVSF